MDALKIGDSVMTLDGSYSKVYSFGHYGPDVKTEFLQIHALGMDQSLEISEDHLLYIYKARDQEHPFLVPASEVEVGDILVMPNQHAAAAQVKTIRKVNRQGLYAPFTTQGDLVVNGVAVSNYIALKDFEKLMSWDLQGWAQHASNAPLRAACHLKLGWSCEEETYDPDTGYSANAMFQLRLKAMFFDGYPRIVQAFFVLIYVTLFMIVEKLVVSGQARLLAAALVYATWKLMRATKKKTKNDKDQQKQKATGKVKAL